MANANDLRRRLVIGAAALSLLTPACSGVRGELDESGQVPDGAPTELAFDEVETEGLVGAQTNFAFRAPELYTGELIEGTELFSNAPVIMVFVVPSCDICHVEAPKLANAAELHPEINYVMVHGFGETTDFLEFNDGFDLSQENVIHLVDTEGALWERFGVTSQPSSVLVDLDGEVSTSRGALGDDGLARAAAQVTQQPVLEVDGLFDNDEGTQPGAGVSTEPESGDATVSEADTDTGAEADTSGEVGTDVDPENDGIDTEEADTGS